MGLFSRLFSFGSKSVQPIEQTRKVLCITESRNGHPIVGWNLSTVTVHSTMIDVNRLRIALLQGFTLPIGWESVYVSGSPRIDSLHGLVSVLVADDYLVCNGNTVRLAESVVIV